MFSTRKKYLIRVLLWPKLSSISILVSDASYFEKQLLKDLFEDYDKNMRPVLNDRETVTVTIGLSLHQIMDVVSVALFSSYNMNVLC